MKFGSIQNIFRGAVRLVASGLIVMTVASCGGGGGEPRTPTSTTTTVSAGSVDLLFSSPELQSSGASGTEVTVTAVVKTTDNNVLKDVGVTFKSDSGALAITDTVTDANGQAKATLKTSGDRTNRTITVTVTAGGKTATGTVNVVGTAVTANGPTSITSGSSADFTITVKDSAGVAVASAPVTVSSANGNTLALKTGGGTTAAPITNSQGQIVMTLTASVAGTDTLTVRSLGATAAPTISVSGTNFAVSAVDSSGAVATQAYTSTGCQKVIATYTSNGVAQTGTINFSTSRGNIYSDSACTTLLSTSVPITAGTSQAVYTKSNTAGLASITGIVAGGPTTQTTLEFVAALTASATVSLQADPAVIGTNTAGANSQQSTLTAVVRDGTAYNNLVKNAVVEFSIVSDKSGGSLSSPSVVTTGSDGSAAVAFIAGPADTPTDGVTLQAKIQGYAITKTVNLTVAKKSLSITAGTGNTVGIPTTSTYQIDYSVFVTDASGNAVPGVTVTASVIPTRYFKGTYVYGTTNWVRTIVTNGTCANEDANKNGILDTGEDFNGNGVLDPGIPLTVTSSGVTNSSGIATVTITYPRDRGNWTEVLMTIRGTVSGTESSSLTTFTLPVLSTDLTSQTVTPPGFPSPYGVNACSLPN